MIKKIGYWVAFIFVVIILTFPLFIKIKIECKSQFGECPQEINAKLQMLNYKFLYQARNKALKILKTDFLVTNFSMQLKLPNILLINTIIKKPTYAIFDKSQNKYLLIDKTGLVLSFSDGTNLPFIIKDIINEKSGDKISDKDLFALKLVEGVNQMYQVGSGLTQNDTLLVDIPTGIRVILPVEGIDRDVLLGSLRLIYTKITTNYAGIYSQIDLRYKNPVLR